MSIQSRIIGERFFNRPAVKVAKELLGRYLVRRVGGKIISGMITETEAYQGFEDKASHAHRGMTKRNFPMFGPAGRWYVYFVYGSHWMLNIVCGPKNYPSAVLIRAAVITSPTLRHCERWRVDASTRQPKQSHNLNGPGRLTRFFKIDKRFNNKPANRRTGLWIATIAKLLITNYKLHIKAAPRIGVSYAGPHWSRKPWRFYLSAVRIAK